MNGLALRGGGSGWGGPASRFLFSNISVVFQLQKETKDGVCTRACVPVGGGGQLECTHEWAGERQVGSLHPRQPCPTQGL